MGGAPLKTSMPVSYCPLNELCVPEVFQGGGYRRIVLRLALSSSNKRLTERVINDVGASSLCAPCVSYSL